MSHNLLEDLIAPFDGVLGRVWRLRPGDLCDRCPMRPECHDRTACLHLVTSAGLSTRLDGPFRRFPMGARQVGSVLLSATPFVAHHDLASLRLAEAGWIDLHRVRSFAAFPLRREGTSVGVFALFSRRSLGSADLRGLAAAADLLALASSSFASGAESREPVRPLRDVEREAIERALARTEGRVSGPRGAARMLGLKPTTLQSRMKKLAVRRPGRPLS
jgi:GAF domain-containing protein